MSGGNPAERLLSDLLLMGQSPSLIQKRQTTFNVNWHLPDGRHDDTVHIIDNCALHFFGSTTAKFGQHKRIFHVLDSGKNK